MINILERFLSFIATPPVLWVRFPNESIRGEVGELSGRRLSEGPAELQDAMNGVFAASATSQTPDVVSSELRSSAREQQEGASDAGFQGPHAVVVDLTAKRLA